MAQEALIVVVRYPNGDPSGSIYQLGPRGAKGIGVELPEGVRITARVPKDSNVAPTFLQLLVPQAREPEIRGLMGNMTVVDARYEHASLIPEIT
jgi:hypothetical protein